MEKKECCTSYAIDRVKVTLDKINNDIISYQSQLMKYLMIVYHIYVPSCSMLLKLKTNFPDML